MNEQQPKQAAAPQERRRVKQVGTVSSIAGAKSIVVRVDRRVQHARYDKFLNMRSKLMAHDERAECSVGDVVEVVYARPLSARKRWRVSRIVKKAAALAHEEVSEP